MKIGIIGFGLEGQAAYDYWKNEGDITICDINNVSVPEGINTQIGSNYLADLARFDLIIRSPFVKPQDLLDSAGQNIKSKITTNTNEFFKACPTKNIIGVTGTKGKGTTSSLITKLLESVGKNVYLGGNIGIPALDLLKNNIKSTDWIVLELSNFQLIDCLYSPQIALCLMVAPEHLDWHSEINEYYNAKTHLFRHQKNDDLAIYNALNVNSQRIASTSRGWKIPYLDIPGAIIKDGYINIANNNICSTEEVGLLGKHNLENICAAITTVWQISQDVDKFKQVLIDFKGLEHRLEFVAEIKGVQYYDDSFATTPESSTVAIEAFKQNKILILGGSDKHADYRQLAETIKLTKVKSVILIGQQGPKIEATLKEAGYEQCVYGGNNMQEIVLTAQAQSSSGDIVLLSPACASFDMFKDYKDRGDQFKQTVQLLV
jgi:UDP-N-acetylmuramoylalanine--D-glutamate ligase